MNGVVIRTRKLLRLHQCLHKYQKKNSSCYKKNDSFSQNDDNCVFMFDFLLLKNNNVKRENFEMFLASLKKKHYPPLIFFLFFGKKLRFAKGICTTTSICNCNKTEYKQNGAHIFWKNLRN